MRKEFDIEFRADNTARLRGFSVRLSFRTQTSIAKKLHLRGAFRQSNCVRNDICIQRSLQKRIVLVGAGEFFSKGLCGLLDLRGCRLGIPGWHFLFQEPLYSFYKFDLYFCTGKGPL